MRDLLVVLRTRGRVLILLALCTAFSLVSAVYFARFLAKPNTGLVANYPEVVVRDGAVIFSPTAPFSPAVAAGLIPHRDEILAVNGLPIHGSLDIEKADSRIKGFDPFPVQVRRDGGDILTVMITPSIMLSRIDWVFVLIFALALACTAFTLSLKIPGESYTLPLVLAALSYLVFTCVKPFYYENALSNFLIHFGKITSWLLVLSGLYFPKPRGPRWLRASLLGAILLVYTAFVAARMTDFFAWRASGLEEWYARYRFLGQINNVADGVAYVAWACLMVSSYLRAGTQAEKKQLLWILAGMLIALPPYFFFDQLPLILGDASSMRMSLGNFAEVFLAFIPIFLIVGLTHHRLFNIRFVLTRYAIYVALFLVMFAFFSLLFLPLRDALARGYHLKPPLGDFFAAALIFLVLVPLRSLIIRIADSALFAGVRRGSPGYLAELERKNAQLQISLERALMHRERALQAGKLSELRAVLRGVVSRLREPARDMAAALIAIDAGSAAAAPDGSPQSAGALDKAVEASVILGDFIRVLESFCGPTVSIPAQTAPDVLLRTAVERVRRKFPLARFSAVLQPAAQISCYPEELVDAFVYVLENAVEAQDGVGSPILVQGSANDSRITIQIEDNGLGITDSEARKLFRPFFTTKPGHQGLGLYFARLIAERVDGTLDIVSSLGGVQASFSFPAVRPSPSGIRKGAAGSRAEDGGQLA